VPASIKSQSDQKGGRLHTSSAFRTQFLNDQTDLSYLSRTTSRKMACHSKERPVLAVFSFFFNAVLTVSGLSRHTTKRVLPLASYLTKDTIWSQEYGRISCCSICFILKLYQTPRSASDMVITFYMPSYLLAMSDTLSLLRVLRYSKEPLRSFGSESRKSVGRFVGVWPALSTASIRPSAP
jgi:hypothetical protein